MIDRTYQIEMNEKQLLHLLDALDLYSRLGMGQLEALDDWIRLKFQTYDADGEGYDSDYIRKLFQNIKAEVWCHPPNGSWGIHNSKVPTSCREAYDIKQVLRKARHSARMQDPNESEETKKWIRFTVDGDSYFPTNPDLPPVKCKVKTSE